MNPFKIYVPIVLHELTIASAHTTFVNLIKKMNNNRSFKSSNRISKVKSPQILYETALIITTMQTKDTPSLNSRRATMRNLLLKAPRIDMQFPFICCRSSRCFTVESDAEILRWYDAVFNHSCAPENYLE